MPKTTYVLRQRDLLGWGLRFFLEGSLGFLGWGFPVRLWKDRAVVYSVAGFSVMKAEVFSVTPPSFLLREQCVQSLLWSLTSQQT